MDARIIIVLWLALVGSHPAQVKPNASGSVPTISYCELIREPELYEGKLVRVSATWYYGFERSSLYHRECMDPENSAWLVFVEEAKGCKRTDKITKKLTNDSANKADVVVLGTLSGGGRYGHMFYYHRQFVVTCLEKAKQIPADAP
jgi:hypothetical protein